MQSYNRIHTAFTLQKIKALLEIKTQVSAAKMNGSRKKQVRYPNHNFHEITGPSAQAASSQIEQSILHLKPVNLC